MPVTVAFNDVRFGRGQSPSMSSHIRRLVVNVFRHAVPVNGVLSDKLETVLAWVQTE